MFETLLCHYAMLLLFSFEKYCLWT